MFFEKKIIKKHSPSPKGSTAWVGLGWVGLAGGWMAGWLAGWLVAGCWMLVGWLVGWLLDAGCWMLDGWLAGCMVWETGFD